MKNDLSSRALPRDAQALGYEGRAHRDDHAKLKLCLLYTSDAADE